jgi:hypothetical protein
MGRTVAGPRRAPAKSKHVADARRRANHALPHDVDFDPVEEGRQSAVGSISVFQKALDSEFKRTNMLDAQA